MREMCVFNPCKFTKKVRERRANVNLQGLNTHIFPIPIQQRSFFKVILATRVFFAKICQFAIVPAAAITNHEFQISTADNGIALIAYGSKKWIYTAYSRPPSETKMWSTWKWTDKTKEVLNIINVVEKDEIKRLRDIEKTTRQKFETLFE